MLPDTKQELLKRFINEKDIFVKAKLLESLIRDAGIRTGEIARQAGVKASYLSQLRRINRLPDEIADSYYAKLISASHLLILARLNSSESIKKAYEEILEQNLTAVDTEALVREKLYSIKKVGNYLTDEEKKAFVADFSARYPEGELSIMQTRIKSKLTVIIRGDLKKTGGLLRKILEKMV